VGEDSQLDELAQAASRIATAVGDIYAADAEPQPFEEALPPPPWTDPEHMPSIPEDAYSSVWWQSIRKAAEEEKMTLEDPKVFHRAFPDSPVPGEAFGVMRGTAPDGRVMRVSFHRMRDPMALRGAVLFPAPEGSEPEEPQLVEETNMYWATEGAVRACWSRAWQAGSIGAEGLVERGVETGRRAGFL
jgi:hypothetical protein